MSSMNILKSMGAGVGALLMMAGAASAQTIQAVSFQASGDTSVKMDLVTVTNTGRVGTTIVLDGTRSTDDGEIKTYTWTQVSGPTAVLKGDTATKPTFTPSTPGTYVFELRATDRAGNTTVVEKRQFTVDAQGPIVDIKSDGSTETGSANGGIWKTVDGGTIKGEAQAKGDVEYTWKVEEGESAAQKANDRLKNAGPRDGWGDEKGGTEDINIGVGEMKGGVSVAAGDVDGLTEEEKAAFLAKVKAHAQVQSGQELENFAKGVLLNDVALKGVKIMENAVEVESQEEAKLFGFIPVGIKLLVTAEVGAERAQDRIKVKLPWWSFLATHELDLDGLDAEATSKIESFTIKQGISGQAQVLSSVSNILKTKHDTAKNSISNIR